ncbi:MAG: nucleotidyltransferase domain-containing protein, partial [Oscillospiraceae bacterium]|nr:nucleotidyltransferase domain-containing protein [Oscillospiraceae bacterium]
EYPLDGMLDINGWDLNKTLRLLHSSNPTLFEWNNSPIVYKTTKEWATVRKEIGKYFLAKSGLYHYLGTALGNYREYLRGDSVKLKKYFYVIRPLLACKWILDKKCTPPMLFSELVEAELEEEMRPIISNLLEQKANTSEMGEGERIDKLNDYIEMNLASLKATIDVKPKERKADWQKLNELFLELVQSERGEECS